MRYRVLFLIVGLIWGMFPWQVTAQSTFTNPVLAHGQDPWVVKYDGQYYYCCAQGNGISVSVSPVLHRIEPPQRVWTAPAEGWNSSCVWAPELHPYKGRWYIYYAAGQSGPPYIHQRTGVLESVDDDPLGPYVDRGMLYTGDSLGQWSSNRWAIDFTLFEYEGQLYGVWSGWADAATTDRTEQNLYIAEMTDPCTVASSRVLISEPDRPYEQGELPLNEGPQILQRGEDLFIVYSCGQSWLPTYKLSYLRLRRGADPMSRSSWVKSRRPVFEGTDEVFGPGHASFTVSPDGTESYIVYHTKTSASPGWQRDVRMQRFEFDRQGRPVFGAPIPVGVAMPIPAGSKITNP